jgi:hypothetical protein
MTTGKLYNLEFASANTTQSTDGFLADQKKITTGVKQEIKKTLAEHGLSKEFSFAAKRVSDTTRSEQIYGTDAAIAVIKTIGNVRKLYEMKISLYPLTREL